MESVNILGQVLRQFESVGQRNFAKVKFKCKVVLSSPLTRTLVDAHSLDELLVLHYKVLSLIIIHPRQTVSDAVRCDFFEFHVRTVNKKLLVAV